MLNPKRETAAVASPCYLTAELSVAILQISVPLSEQVWKKKCLKPADVKLMLMFVCSEQMCKCLFLYCQMDVFEIYFQK